jgi:N-acetylneuraminic acid mutarotase
MKRLVALLAAIGCGSPPTELDGNWSTAPPLPARVQEMHAAVLGGRIYVAGGFDSTNAATAAAFRFDPLLNSWERIADLPAPRHHMPLAVLGDTLYAVGGLLSGTFNGAATLWLYREDLNEWHARASLPVGRGASAAVGVEGEGVLVVVGGLGPTGTLVAATALYSPAADAWGSGANMPTPRDHLTAQLVDDVVYVIGGRANNPDINYDIIQAYDVGPGIWSTRSPMPSRRGGLGSAVIDGRIHTVGGETASDVFANHEVYDPVDNRWLIAPPLPTARHGLAVAAFGGALYAIGGGPSAGFSQTNVVEVFVP